jgi:pimeloyl-ACP methyl ester carboxylesterase
MTRKNVGIASALVAGTVGAGFAALKLVVRSDRRRVGITPAELESAISTPSSFSLPADCRQSTVTRADGTSIYVVERGNPTAPPVVLLHGVTLAASIWRHQFEDLVAEYRVIAIDWRGHGASTVGTDGYGLAPLAHDLHAVLEQLDLKGAVLVGHSMGGMAIMAFCRLHANTLYRRVNGLVFQSTAASQVAGPAAPLSIGRPVR